MLTCDLLIKNELNLKFNFITAEYTIIKVHKVQHKYEQLSFSFE